MVSLPDQQGRLTLPRLTAGVHVSDGLARIDGARGAMMLASAARAGSPIVQTPFIPDQNCEMNAQDSPGTQFPEGDGVWGPTKMQARAG